MDKPSCDLAVALRILYLNIRYEEGELYCITGTALKFFTLDKALEVQWDESVREFFRSRQIPCTQEGIN